MSRNISLQELDSGAHYDPDLMKKAISMVFREIISALPCGADVRIKIHDSGDNLEIVFGELDKDNRVCELFDPELQGKLWSHSLFLNIAHKIISEHRGKLLLDPAASTTFPIIIKIPFTPK